MDLKVVVGSCTYGYPVVIGRLYSSSMVGGSNVVYSTAIDDEDIWVRDVCLCVRVFLVIEIE